MGSRLSRAIHESSLKYFVLGSRDSWIVLLPTKALSLILAQLLHHFRKLLYIGLSAFQ